MSNPIKQRPICGPIMFLSLIGWTICRPSYASEKKKRNDASYVHP